MSLYVLTCSFSLLIISGYGDITPKSDGGKILYIFYSIIGIPMMIWYLAASGELQTRGYQALLGYLRTNVWKKEDRIHKDIPPVIISSFVFIIYWIIGSVLVREIMHMTMVNSLYYWFVTFTTTGFGDILLNQKGVMKFYPWMIFKLFGFNLIAGIVHSVVVWINGISDKKEAFCCSCWHEETIHDPGTDRYNIAFATRLEATPVSVQTENRVYMGR